MKGEPPILFAACSVAASLTGLLLVGTVGGTRPTHPSTFAGTRVRAFLPHADRTRRVNCPSSDSLALLSTTIRGGVLEDEDEYDEYDLDESDVDVEEEEEEEGEVSEMYDLEEDEEEEDDEILTESTLASVRKARERQASRSKQVVKEAFATKKGPKTKRKKKLIKSFLKSYFRVPYLIRACLNPFTVIAMTKAYFASLFNIGYLEEDASQGLRSALEEKAKKEGGGPKGGRKGKRAMRPGQAKTLSDLPQLSA